MGGVAVRVTATAGSIDGPSQTACGVNYWTEPDAAQRPYTGGTVVSEASYDSGGNVVCRDDQGREFQLWQPAPGY